jgi:two-component system LytT family response regulator
MIVDDEAVARSRLRRLLAAHADVTIAAEAADGRSALDAILAHRPDLVFLDVRMPELDGFEVLAELSPHEIPAIVFVTAFSDHAPKAFDVGALDYLLKPYDPERLAQTLTRARDRQREAGAEASKQLLAAIETLTREQRALRSALGARPPHGVAPPVPAERLQERILVTRRGHGVFVTLADVDYVESAGNYIKLHVGSEAHRLRVRLSDMEQRLDPTRFARIHRTVIVNITRVAEIQPWFSGDAIVMLTNGTKLRLSRHYRTAIEAMFGLTLHE